MSGVSLTGINNMVGHEELRDFAQAAGRSPSDLLSDINAGKLPPMPPEVYRVAATPCWHQYTAAEWAKGIPRWEAAAEQRAAAAKREAEIRRGHASVTAPSGAWVDPATEARANARRKPPGFM